MVYRTGLLAGQPAGKRVPSLASAPSDCQHALIWPNASRKVRGTEPLERTMTASFNHRSSAQRAKGRSTMARAGSMLRDGDHLHDVVMSPLTTADCAALPILCVDPVRAKSAREAHDTTDGEEGEKQRHNQTCIQPHGLPQPRARWRRIFHSHAEAEAGIMEERLWRLRLTVCAVVGCWRLGLRRRRGKGAMR